MNKTRVNLSEVLPLDTPFSVHIFPSYYCNFKCSYCLHSLSKEVLSNRGFKQQKMKMNTYYSIINELNKFPNKLKTIIFAGHGEPLTHTNLPQMIRYAKGLNVSERVEIVTNASLLTKEMADNLIEANLDLLRVSIQGITDEMYKQTCGIDIKVQTIFDNLAYFYKHKKTTHIELKIIDIAVPTEEDKNKFFEVFTPVSDSISIEYLIPFIPEIDHSKIKEDLTRCKHGNNCSGSKVCSMPFYMIVIEPDGNIVPCCSSVVPASYGNTDNDNLIDIWNNKKHLNFLQLQLNNIYDNKVCSECSVPKFGLQTGDYLDSCKEILLKKYTEMKCRL